MGFGTAQQVGNRPRSQGSGVTNLSDIFQNNIGAPTPIGQLQNPNQLFSMIQALLQPNQQQENGQTSTPISQVMSPVPKQNIDAMPLQNMNQISNPFGKLINQRFLR